MINQKKIIAQTKKLESKLRSDLCDYSDAYIVVKGNVIVNKKTFTEESNNTAVNVTATHTENDNSFGF